MKVRFIRLTMALAVAGAGMCLNTSEASAASIAAVASIASGYDQSCAVSGTDLYCWGGNSHGQLGDGTNTPRSTPALVAGGYAWTSVSAGQNLTCGVTTTNVGYCWGENDDGEVGMGNQLADHNTPTLVTGSYSWTSISAGINHACGLTTGGAAYCWGLAAMGDGSPVGQHSAPVLVTGGYTWRSVTAGKQHSCGVTTGNVGYCWGRDVEGQLGDGANTDQNSPTPISGSLSWSTVGAALGDYTCGVTTTNVGYCWGHGGWGALGDGSSVSHNIPTAVSGGYSFASISGGSAITCGVLTNNTVKCWGAGALGAIGNSGWSDSNVPANVSGGYAALQVSTGGGGACMRTASYAMYCWGWDANGTLGDGGSTNQNAPVGVIGFANLQSNSVVAVAIDSSFTFTIGNRSTACNGESNFQAGAGAATGISLGHLSAGSNVSGAQALTVASNAGGGFGVFIRGTQSTQNLRSASHNWADVAGTYASPAALGSGERFGYTYKDSTSSTSVSNPSSASFVALDNTNRAVMGSSSSAGGSGCVSFDAQASSATAAAAYSATIVYLAVPTF